MRILNIQNANSEQLHELQLKQLDILKELKKILDSKGIEYFIIGGTLIGAVRNNGFIPWDDDIDVIMKREDYEKLYMHPNWLEGTSLMIQRSDSVTNQHLTGMILKDKNTTFINKHSLMEDITHSVGIDILPLDYRPVGRIKQKRQIFYAMVFSLYNADRLPDHQGKLLKILAEIPLKLVPSRKARYKIWSSAEKKMIKLGDKRSGEVVELGVGIKALFRYDDARWFDRTVKLSFEDTEFSAPVGYDAYLKAVVGDYMKLPPKDSRMPKHNTYLVDTEVPFTKNMRIEIIKNNDK